LSVHRLGQTTTEIVPAVEKTGIRDDQEEKGPTRRTQDQSFQIPTENRCYAVSALFPLLRAARSDWKLFPLAIREINNSQKLVG
jgi:hypothetical protein